MEYRDDPDLYRAIMASLDAGAQQDSGPKNEQKIDDELDVMVRNQGSSPYDNGKTKTPSTTGDVSVKYNINASYESHGRASSNNYADIDSNK